MKIAVLCNDEAREGFFSEHGLSLLIDEETLFDTGTSDVAVINAEKMGVDLGKVKRVIISHGHYDHGGGLIKILERTGRIDVYLHEKALLPKYSGSRFAGFPYEWRIAEKMADVHLIKGDTEIDGFYVLNNVETQEEKIDRAFLVNGKHDLFEDELNLYTRGTLVTGCAHRGIDNILKAAEKGYEVRNVVGGFHLKDSSDERIEEVIETLLNYNVRVFPMHCTGQRAMAIMKERLGEKCVLPKSGDVIEV